MSSRFPIGVATTYSRPSGRASGSWPGPLAVEAGVRMSLDRYLGLNGGFVGMHEFGASGKIADVYKKFGITTEAVVQTAKDVLAKAS